MNSADTLAMAAQAIARNKLRSFLTTLGIIIGVASVIAMVHLGQSATRSVAQQFANIGSNLLFVMPGVSQHGPSALRISAEPFEMNDVAAIRREVAEVLVAPAVSRNETVVFGNANQNIRVEGTTNEYFEVRNHPVARGQRFEESELSSGAAVCVIGTTVVEEMYSGGEALGTNLRVGRTACRVVGILDERGQSMGQDRDRVIIMPIKSVQRRLAGNLEVNTIYISALREGTSSLVKAEVESLLRQRRRIAPDADDDFYVRDTQDIMDALSETTATMTLLLGGIAAVSLLVGGIGIMNIMLVSVTERTREIGIRLAIGARTRDVLRQFLVESVVLATLGGIIGVVIGVASTWLMTYQFNMPFVISPGVIVLGFAFSMSIGILFGYFPARKAAHLNPIDALRHE